MFQAIRKFLEKSPLNGQATVLGGHAIRWITVKQRYFWCFKQFGKFFWKKSLNVTRQWSEVTRPLDDCQTTFFRRFKRFGKILKKVPERHATVVGGHATVVWLSNNVFFRRFKRFEKIFENKSLKVTREWSEVTRPLYDCQATFFLTFQAIREISWKQVPEGHAGVVGGHATVGWLLSNVFLTFQTIRKFLEKSHWRSRDSGRRSRDRWMTVKQLF